MDSIKEKQQVMTDFEIDQIKEVMNIGVSHASTALSKILDKRVTISVPEAIIDSVDKVSDIIGNEKDLGTAVLMSVTGVAPGVMTFIFPHSGDRSGAVNLIEMVTKDRISDPKSLSDYEVSVIKEVGNILAGSLLSAFSKFLSFELKQSISEVITDSLGAIINSIAAEIGTQSDIAIVFKVAFKIEGEENSPELFFFIDPVATSKILNSTKTKLS